MQNFIPVEAVTERDIDLLLLEEFRSSQQFCEWFLERAALDKNELAYLGAWHSVTQGGLGESDLAVKFKKRNGEHYLFLIENKIDANFTKDQAARYRLRAKTYLEQGECAEQRTVLIAPREYLSVNHSFDLAITYEEVRGWFLNQKELGPRAVHKAEMISLAIEKQRRGYQPIRDEDVSVFWQEYWGAAVKYYPRLHMKKPDRDKPWGADFLGFKPVELIEEARLIHKLERGTVDLELSGIGHALEQVRKDLATHLKEGMRLVKTGKSVSVRYETAALDLSKPFDTQRNKVMTALQKADDLYEWSLQNQKTLEMILKIGEANL